MNTRIISFCYSNTCAPFLSTADKAVITYTEVSSMVKHVLAAVCEVFQL
jgi:hypothetical protein